MPHFFIFGDYMNSEYLRIKKNVERWYTNECKKYPSLYEKYTEETAETLAQLIGSIYLKNEKLTKENKKLKNQLDKIPNFIKKIFI